MNNNDILRRLRYVFDFDDSKMIEIFALANCKVTRSQVSDWLKQDDNSEFKNCEDSQLASFLNGLITLKRGAKDGPAPTPETKLNNNIIFNKIKIALNLKAEEILEILATVDFNISKHELSALFRSPEHKHYRPCMDQLLRNFLNGIQLKYRDTVNEE